MKTQRGGMGAGDITVNAVYTEVEAPIDPPTSEPDEPADSSTSEPTTSEPTTSEPEAEKKGGCGSVIGGVSAALAMVAAAAVVLKKKED